MLPRNQDIYATAPVRRLLNEQTRAMTPALQRSVGDYALLIGAAPDDAPLPALPMLGCWIKLRVQADDYRGDLRARVDESLPFIDDAFELVLLQHALEATPMHASLLDEAIRVVAPGGVLAITGIHPISIWSSWFHWRSRGRPLALRMPLQLSHALQRAGFEIEQIRRVGGVLPRSVTARAASVRLLGGGYVLVARKRRRAVTPLRLQPKPVAAVPNGRLSPSTRRTASL